MNNAVIILDSWLENVPSNYIYEYKKDGTPDLGLLQAQNRAICRTVYSGPHYGFSCQGIKQIPGVAEHCTKECEEKIQQDITVTLFEGMKAKYRGKRMSIAAECIGRQDGMFILPKVIKASCVRTYSRSDVCATCPLFGSDGDDVTFEIGASHRSILRFLEPSNIPLAGKISAMIGVARKNCRAWRYSYTEQNAETIYVVPPLTNEYHESQRHTRQTAYHLGYGIKTNETYIFSGYVHVNERTNIAKLVFDSKQEAKDSLEDFELTPEIKKHSAVFRPNGETPLTKLNSIAQNLSYNHIRIWGREQMITAIDLAYHSVRRFMFQEKLQRGWLNILIIGDSGQGKSEATKGLMQHYDLGYHTSAESATRAGLLWGVNTKDTGPMYLIWGAIPRNSGKLVVIDELKEIVKSGEFGKLTEARSAGVVNVDTIASGHALAETRIIMLTNPPGKRRMGSYMCPVESIPDLIPDNEDIRRFDLVVGVASKEVSDDVIHQNIRDMPVLDEIYTQGICKNHLMWIWSLGPEDVIIRDEIERAILKASLQMCDDYSSVIPIVEPADQREKLARLSVAIAARLCSMNSQEKLSVSMEHVDAAHKFMDSIYKSDALQYDEFSRINADIRMDDDAWEELIAQWRNAEWAPWQKPFAYYIAEEGYVMPKIMSAATDCKLSIVTQALNWMAAQRLMRLIKGGGYVKTPNGVVFIKKLLQIDAEKEREKQELELGEEF